MYVGDWTKRGSLPRHDVKNETYLPERRWEG